MTRRSPNALQMNRSGMRSGLALASWILLLFFISSRLSTKNPPQQNPKSFSRHLLQQDLVSPPAAAEIPRNAALSSNQNCENVRAHPGFADTCAFIKAHPQCSSGGLIEYSQVFFCQFRVLPWLGYTLLSVWLASLFYMLGNTAADYFCCSLQKLSSLLHLPPTVAGVTLLPLGNGAPDVFASIAAFVGAGAGEVGLNSVLGGAVFVTSVVAGMVYVITAGRSSSPVVELDRNCFIRDVCFFLFTLLCLSVILYVGRISFWGAVAFLSIYLIYAICVATSEVIKKQAARIKWRPMQALIEDESEENWYSPLLDPDSSSSNLIEITLPQWRWASNVAIYAHQQQSPEDSVAPRPLWGWSEEQGGSQRSDRSWKVLLRSSCKMIIDGPLTLPRQLTIPLVEEDARWSRPIAVASVVLAPVLLAVLFSAGLSARAALWGLGIGAAFGTAAYLTTVSDHPPRKFVFPWVAAGFVMSIVWFYIIAKELVAVLVSLGMILEIDSSILGLTVLAWGNSMGDLMANTAMAINGGEGVQVAVSGCYAGPMFNTLAGLGMSLLLSSLKSFPDSFVIPADGSLLYTIGFLIAGLLWSLLLLPGRRMQPSRFLGGGLLVLYVLFLGLKILQTSGYVQ